MEDGTSIHLLPFIIIILLLLCNAYFVAAEYSLVRIRTTRIDQLIKEGNKRAVLVKKVLGKLETHLSATQLGVTLSSLGIGAVAEPSISRLLEAGFHSFLPESVRYSLSYIIGFLIATILHITIGEQIPKMSAIEKAEKIVLWAATPLYWYCKITYPFIIILNGLTAAGLRLVGIRKVSTSEEHTDEEIKLIVSSSAALDPDEQEMLGNIFSFNERFIREIMVHRTEMDCVYLSDPIEETIEFIKESNHSRFPVCGEDRDDILGYINIRDLYKLMDKVPIDKINLEEIKREIPKFYETTSVQKAMRRMQKNHQQIGIVIDEYGGVSGLVTLEDIVEEIVGEIQDEYDDEEEPFIVTNTGIMIDASLLIDEVNTELGIELEEIDGIDTIGGYVLSKIEHPPEVGKKITVPNYEITVVEIEDQRIIKLHFVEIKKEEKPKEEE